MQSFFKYILVLLLITSIFIMTLGFVPNEFALEVRKVYDKNVIIVQSFELERRPLDTSTHSIRRTINTLAGPSSNIVLNSPNPNFRLLTQDFSIDNSTLLDRLEDKPQELAAGISLPQNNDNSSDLTCLPITPNYNKPHYLYEKSTRVPFRESVREFSKKYHLNEYLVYAIMHTESGFNPSVISNRYAHGLMQIVPETAGEEVHRYLHGRDSGLPKSSDLLNPHFNIKYGITYIHLLMTYHLAGINDPLSLEYCTIAAYNGGSGAVLRVFGRTNEQAIAKINTFAPKDLYRYLQNNLPTTETKNFLHKVTTTKASLNLQAGR